MPGASLPDKISSAVGESSCGCRVGDQDLDPDLSPGGDGNRCEPASSRIAGSQESNPSRGAPNMPHITPVLSRSDRTREALWAPVTLPQFVNRLPERHPSRTVVELKDSAEIDTEFTRYAQIKAIGGYSTDRRYMSYVATNPSEIYSQMVRAHPYARC